YIDLADQIENEGSVPRPLGTPMELGTGPGDPVNKYRMKMKKIVLLFCLFVGSNAFSQGNDELLAHYRAYYQEMRLQGDVNGVIGALTHINLLSPSQARKDTLAFVYMNNGQHMQALNTIGVEKDPNDSDLAVQIKAVSLKALGQPKRALEPFEALFQREPSPYVASELAALKIR